MNLVIAGRGKGKTTELIRLSNGLNKPIVVSGYSKVTHIKKMAKEMGLEIPEPLTVSEWLSHKSVRGINQSCLVDDLDIVLHDLGLNVEYASIDTPCTILENSEKPW